jgi:hypothetical protein
MEHLPKIVRQRLQATAKAELHPDPDLLTAFVEKSLHERERAGVLQHLGQCADCRNVVSLAMPKIAVPSTIPARSSWLSWPVLRWGALAACVVVVGAVVTLHYEGRQGAEPVAEKAPAEKAPAPPQTLTVETQASKEPGQKLAEKIAPPSPVAPASPPSSASPFQSDRDFEAANKPARQRERAEAGSAASTAVVNGLATGRLENHPLENNLPGTDQRRSDQLTDNRLAKSDALKSSDKPSALAGGQRAGAAPASQLAADSASANSPSTESKTAHAEEQPKQQNENLDYASGISETVTVQAEAPPVETAQAAVARAKDESDKKVQSNSGAGRVVVPRVSRNTHDLSNVTQSTQRWTISADGALQRSFDSGKSWQTIPVANHAVFRALAANDSDIWVGGTAGALYHSSDAGQTWTQIKPVAEGISLTADILRVEFADARHGSLTTGNHEIWITSDGGASWQRK